MTPGVFALPCKLVGEAPEVVVVAAGSEGWGHVPGATFVGNTVDPEAPDGPCIQRVLHPFRARAFRWQSARAAAHQPAKFFATKSQFTRFQNDSTYLGRALR